MQTSGRNCVRYKAKRPGCCTVQYPGRSVGLLLKFWRPPGDFKYPQELCRAYLNLFERERERIGAAVLERADAPRLLLRRRRLPLRINMRIIINIASMATAISTQNSHGEPVSPAPGSNIRGLSEGSALIMLPISSTLLSAVRVAVSMAAPLQV